MTRLYSLHADCQRLAKSFWEMPRRVTARRGQVLTLDTKLGEGGEGAVFSVREDPGIVAKLYLAAPSGLQGEKLELMCSMASDRLSEIAAWPKDVLYDNGQRIGFTMPKVVNQLPFHEVVGPRQRRHFLPDADFGFLVHAAVNLAGCFEVLHGSHVVVGDVNPNNVLVFRDSTIRVIDCDSFQVARNGTIYPCRVGMAEFQPPELQGVNFDTVVRFPQQDLFGLAILLFELLFVGRHPFIGSYPASYKGPQELDFNIKNGRYFYGSSRPLGFGPPPGVPLPATLPSDISQKFEQAFALNAASRPTANEWRVALQAMETRLVVCGHNASHRYVGGQPCPWCRARDLTGNEYFFISVTTKVGADGVDETIWRVFDANAVAAAWRRIEAVPKPPQRIPTKPTLPRSQARRVPALERRFGTTLAITIGVLFLITICAASNFIFDWSGAFWTSAIVLWIGLAMAKPVANEELTKRAQARAIAESEFNRAFDRLSRNEQATEFFQVLGELSNLHDQAQKQSTLYDAEFRNLEQNKRNEQLSEFLDNYYIDNATIRGIGPQLKVVLRSFGYETANDLNSGVIQVSGIGPVKYQALMNWRGGISSKFKFDPAKPLSQTKVKEIKERHANLRRNLARRLQEGPGRLSAIASTLQEQRNRLRTDVDNFAIQLSQAVADEKYIARIAKKG